MNCAFSSVDNPAHIEEATEAGLRTALQNNAKGLAALGTKPAWVAALNFVNFFFSDFPSSKSSRLFVSAASSCFLRRDVLLALFLEAEAFT
jgi:hypothetical protein